MIVVNLIEKAAKVGKKLKHSERVAEIVVNERSVTLGELDKWTKDLNCSAEDIIGENKIKKFADNIDIEIMRKQIEILKGATTCTADTSN